MEQSEKKTILIVEDEISLRRALEDKFSKEGFDVLTAQDGEEGLDIAIRKQPDMILLDIIMPKMDGLTMLSKLHEDAWGKMAKVIMLTNLSDAESVGDSLTHGAYGYLVKTNWTLEEIVAKVEMRLAE